jgi:hypothetical protein
MWTRQYPRLSRRGHAQYACPIQLTITTGIHTNSLFGITMSPGQRTIFGMTGRQRVGIPHLLPRLGPEQRATRAVNPIAAQSVEYLLRADSMLWELWLEAIGIGSIWPAGEGCRDSVGGTLTRSLGRS